VIINVKKQVEEHFSQNPSPDGAPPFVAAAPSLSGGVAAPKFEVPTLATDPPAALPPPETKLPLPPPPAQAPIASYTTAGAASFPLSLQGCVAVEMKGLVLYSPHYMKREQPPAGSDDLETKTYAEGSMPMVTIGVPTSADPPKSTQSFGPASLVYAPLPDGRTLYVMCVVTADKAAPPNIATAKDQST